MSISDAGSAARRCGEIADDGAQCWRAEHPTDPDAHDFTPPPQSPVDGGRKWSDWIQMVHEARALLTVEVVTDDQEIERQGNVEQWTPDFCRQIILALAGVLGMSVDGTTIRE